MDEELVEATAKRLHEAKWATNWHALPAHIKDMDREAAVELLQLISPMIAGQALQQAAEDMPRAVIKNGGQYRWLMQRGEKMMEEARHRVTPCRHHRQ